MTVESERNRIIRQVAASFAAALVVSGCGSVVELPPVPSEPVVLLSCFKGVVWEPMLTSSLGAHCGGPGSIDGFTQFAFVGFELVALPSGGPAGGITSVRHEFFPSLNKELRVLRSAILSRGKYLAAAIVTTAIDAVPGNPATLTVVILEQNGALLQEYQLETIYENWGISLDLFGDDRGIFAVGYRFGDDIGTEVLAANGYRSGKLDGFLPLTNPDERGYIAVQDERDVPTRPVFWLDPCTQERAPAKRNDVSVGGSAPSRAALLYLDVTANDMVFEKEREEVRTHLGATPAYWLDSHPRGYVLLRTDDPAKLIVYPSANELTIVLPPGLRRYDAIPGPGFDSAAREIHITGQGLVSLPMRDDTRGFLYVTQNGQDWKPIGLPIGEVYRAYSGDSNGSYLHFGSDFAVSLPAWNAPPAGENRIDGMSLQFARAIQGATIVDASNSRRYHLTTDGGCVAWAEGGSIVRANCMQQTTQTFKLTDDPNWALDAVFTWVNGDDVEFLAQ